MKALLKKPDIMVEAEKTSKGHNLFLEILIFIGVYFVSNLLLGLIAGVIFSVYLLLTPETLSMITSGEGAFNAKVLMEKINAPQFQGVLIQISLYLTLLSTAVAMLYCRVIEKRKLRTMGFVKRGALRDYLVGMLVGFVMFSAAVGICVITGTLQFNGLSSSISFAAIGIYFGGFLLQGMSEEVILRGYFMVSSARKSNVFWAVMVNSLLFGLLHLGNSDVSILAIVNIVLFGIFASVYMIKRGSIWGIAAIHSIWNFVQGNFYGIKVSGFSKMESVFSTDSLQSGTLINGGDFGLEGGLGVTAVLVLGIVIVLFLVREPKGEKAEI